MEKNTLLLLNLMVIIPLVFGDEVIQCNEVQDALNICKKDNELVYVNQTKASDYVTINDSQSLSIAPNALRDVPAKYLRFELKGNSLEFHSDSFQVQAELNSLTLKSAIISLERDVFKAIPKLRTLMIVESKFIELNEGAFAGLSDLRQLTIERTNMSIVKADTFNGIGSKLYYLQLPINEISMVELGSFNNFNRVDQLALQYNQLKDIEPGVFNGMENLRLISLNNNQLTTVRRNVYNNLKNLRHLYLDDNAITMIEAGAFDGVSLYFLGLDHNRLTTIDAGIFNGISIHILSIYDDRDLRIEENAFNNFNSSKICLNSDRIPISDTWGLPKSTKLIPSHC